MDDDNLVYLGKVVDRIAEIIIDEPSGQLTQHEVEERYCQEHESINLSLAGQATFTELLLSDAALDRFKVWDKRYGISDSPTAAHCRNGRTLSIACFDHPPIEPGNHYSDDSRRLREKIYEERARYVEHMEAIPVMERRVKRIVRQVGRTTEDGFVSVDRLSSLKDLAKLAVGNAEIADDQLIAHFVDQHMSNKFLIRDEPDGSVSIGERKTVEEKARGDCATGSVGRVMDDVDQLAEMARRLANEGDTLSPDEAEEPPPSTTAAVRAWFASSPEPRLTQDTPPPLRPSSPSDMPSEFVRTLPMDMQSRVRDQVPSQYPFVLAVHEALRTGAEVILPVAVTQAESCCQMYVIVRDECTLEGDQTIGNHLDALVALDQQLLEVYGTHGAEWHIPKSSQTHVYEGMVVVCKYQEQWTRCRVGGRLSEDAVTLTSIDYGTKIGEQRLDELFLLEASLAGQPPLCALLGVSDIQHLAGEAWYSDEAYLAAVNDYDRVMSRVLNQHVVDPMQNVALRVQSIELNHDSTVVIGGRLLGLDRQSFTRYLVEYPHIVPGGKPVCRWKEGCEPKNAGTFIYPVMQVLGQTPQPVERPKTNPPQLSNPQLSSSQNLPQHPRLPSPPFIPTNPSPLLQSPVTDIAESTSHEHNGTVVTSSSGHSRHSQVRARRATEINEERRMSSPEHGNNVPNQPNHREEQHPPIRGTSRRGRGRPRYPRGRLGGVGGMRRGEQNSAIAQPYDPRRSSGPSNAASHGYNDVPVVRQAVRPSHSDVQPIMTSAQEEAAIERALRESEEWARKEAAEELEAARQYEQRQMANRRHPSPPPPYSAPRATPVPTLMPLNMPPTQSTSSAFTAVVPRAQPTVVESTAVQPTVVQPTVVRRPLAQSIDDVRRGVAAPGEQRSTAFVPVKTESTGASRPSTGTLDSAKDVKKIEQLERDIANGEGRLLKYPNAASALRVVMKVWSRELHELLELTAGSRLSLEWQDRIYNLHDAWLKLAERIEYGHTCECHSR